MMQDEVFAQLVDSHYAGLYRYALSLAKSSSDACDLTQQTFFVWAKKGHTLRDLNKAKTWLFTTLYREFLRNKRLSARVTAIEDLSPRDQDFPAAETDPLAKLDSQMVMGALQEVDAIFRGPLTLFYLQELSYQEIADSLEIPIGTVMSRLSRGKAELRAALARKAKGGKVIDFPNAQGQRQ
jgi:RNA polymerase sigma-70 factor (ECF subfamily)